MLLLVQTKVTGKGKVVPCAGDARFTLVISKSPPGTLVPAV
jgi:hypothetical protein